MQLSLVCIHELFVEDWKNVKFIMPPKAKALRSSTETTAPGRGTCAICCQKLAPKDEVLFCSGSCQKHLHRYCAGVGEPSYKSLSSDGAEPFLCYCCFRAQKDEQVSMLLNTIESMKRDISALKAKDEEVPPSSRSYSAATKEIPPASTRGESGTYRSNTYQQPLNHERLEYSYPAASAVAQRGLLSAQINYHVILSI